MYMRLCINFDGTGCPNYQMRSIVESVRQKCDFHFVFYNYCFMCYALLSRILVCSSFSAL